MKLYSALLGAALLAVCGMRISSPGASARTGDTQKDGSSAEGKRAAS